ncbi:MAG TPA: helix-turn-helix domain-containing protein [Acidimicrobiales bacterium]|nr:helix-turn-helix domain-containing protein [Acidimicrobiales bacterium]
MTRPLSLPNAELLTVEEAAAALNVTVRFIRRLVAERRIAVVRLGRHVRFARHDLDAFVLASRSEAIQAPTRLPGRLL